MTIGTSSSSYYDPFSAEIDRNVHAVWRLMREEQPVYWNERYGFWALSRFEDVWTGYHDTATFSSTHGVQPEALDKPVGAHFCLGAALARLEARVALAGTLARFPRWDIDPSELVPVQTSTVRGFSSVPIHLG